MNHSKITLSTPSVATLGEHSHSDVALSGMEQHTSGIIRLHRDSMRAIFEAGKQGAIMWLPYETSRACVGPVASNITFNTECHLEMIAAYHHPVDNRWGGTEGLDLYDARSIVTFEPARRQCLEFIAKHSHATVDTDVESTADAARKVAKEMPDAIAIGTAQALQAQGLTVSEETANDVPPDENITTFGLWQYRDEPVQPDPKRLYHAMTVTLKDKPGALSQLTHILRPVDLVSLRSDEEIDQRERSFFIEMRRMVGENQMTDLVHQSEFQTMVKQLEGYRHLISHLMWRGSYDHMIYADGNGHTPRQPDGSPVHVDAHAMDPNRPYHHVVLTPYNVHNAAEKVLSEIATAGVNLESFRSENRGHRSYDFDTIFDIRQTESRSLETLIHYLRTCNTVLQSLKVVGSFDEPIRST